MGLVRAVRGFIRWVNWPLVVSLTVGLVVCALAAASTPRLAPWFDPLAQRLLGASPTSTQIGAAFVTAMSLAVAAAWARAAGEGRLTLAAFFAGGERTRRPHISGGGVVGSLLLAAGVAALVGWASRTREPPPISEDWGLVVVYGLAALFLGAALLPLSSVLRPVSVVTRPFNLVLRPIGVMASILDSILVFAVAGAAGAGEGRAVWRYLVLALMLTPCAVLGFHLPPPWSFVPLAWACLVVLAIARRWSWIEEDRNLYLMTRTWVSPQQRIGFSQDLRDEALVGFVALLFFVPLVLRQAHLMSVDAETGVGVFTVSLDAAQHFSVWLGFYGTELAKAVPFVDWAEIYRVEGASQIAVETSLARHLVFATRVLVDLVLLASLVQAFAISARNARQLDLFYGGHLTRLDPFLEPREFRRLLHKDTDGKWAVDRAAAAQFPKYDPVRLVELSREHYAPLNEAAKALRRLQTADSGGDFHDRLSQIALTKSTGGGPNRAALLEVIGAIRGSQTPVLPIEIEQVRMELNGRPAVLDVRKALVDLVVEAPASIERTRALASAAAGLVTFEMPQDPVTYERGDPPAPARARDSVQEVRRIALDALIAELPSRETLVIDAVRAIARDDPAGGLRSRARRALEEAGEDLAS